MRGPWRGSRRTWAPREAAGEGLAVGAAGRKGRARAGRTAQKPADCPRRARMRRKQKVGGACGGAAENSNFRPRPFLGCPLSCSRSLGWASSLPIYLSGRASERFVCHFESIVEMLPRYVVRSDWHKSLCMVQRLGGLQRLDHLHYFLSDRIGSYD